LNESASSIAAPPHREASPGGRGFICSLALWLFLYAASLTLYNAAFHLTSGVLIRYAQTIPAVRLLEITLPNNTFRYTSTSISTPGIDMQILRGCDGMEAWLLLTSALLVFPMPWRHRGIGIILGTVVIFVFNLIRITSLFHVVLRRPAWFDVAHGVIWQTLMVLIAAAFVMFWLDPQRVYRAQSSHAP